jgi:hypothetical protein
MTANADSDDEERRKIRALTEEPAAEFIVTVTQLGTDEGFSRACSGNIVVGRGDDVDIQLAHPAVSRHHAEISLNRDLEFVVRDLGSRNGTIVNDERLEGPEAVIGTDLRVEVGPYVLALALPATYSETIEFSAQRRGRRVRLSAGTHALEIDGKPVTKRLAGLEFRLFELLVAAAPNLVPNADIGEALWGKGQWDSYMLHNLVRRVRKKLEDAGYRGDEIIASVPGVGYRLT